MLKIIGSVCIFSVAVGASIYFIQKLKEQERQLLTIKEMLICLEKQMEYVGLPLADLLREFAKKSREPFESVCREFLDCLEQKQVEDVAALWREILLKHRNEFALSREEFEMFSDVGRLFEPTDTKSQIALTELYKSRINEKIQRMWTEQKEKQKVYQSVCIMGGMILILILL